MTTAPVLTATQIQPRSKFNKTHASAEVSQALIAAQSQAGKDPAWSKRLRVSPRHTGVVFPQILLRTARTSTTARSTCRLRTRSRSANIRGLNGCDAACTAPTGLARYAATKEWASAMLCPMALGGGNASLVPGCRPALIEVSCALCPPPRRLIGGPAHGFCKAMACFSA